MLLRRIRTRKNQDFCTKLPRNEAIFLCNKNFFRCRHSIWMCNNINDLFHRKTERNIFLCFSFSFSDARYKRKWNKVKCYIIIYRTTIFNLYSFWFLVFFFFFYFTLFVFSSAHNSFTRTIKKKKKDVFRPCLKKKNINGNKIESIKIKFDKMNYLCNM